MYSVIPQKGELHVDAVCIGLFFLQLHLKMIMGLAREEAAPFVLLPDMSMLVDMNAVSLGCLTGKKY